MIFPTEIVEQIVLEAGELKIAQILRKYISKYVYDQLEKNILIYGDVQSGKTKQIINFLKREEDKNEYKVLVVQNSKLVLKQYISRFKDENIKFQILTKDTKKIKEKLIILMNNSHRYNYFQKFDINRYILIIDEADMCINSCPLQGYKNVHITATPFNFKPKKKISYDKTIITPKNNNYYGLENVKLYVDNHHTRIVQNFLLTDGGILLNNRETSVENMKATARLYASNYTSTPIILLTNEKLCYLNNQIIHLPKKFSVSNIIDEYKHYKHIIFIANRLANRGISFVSSDYTRHLTHQITRSKINVANFIQGLRLLGVYKDSPELSLYITSSCLNLLHKQGLI